MENSSLKQCAFCNQHLTNDNRSKEHVIPRWLLDFLKISEEIIEPTHFSHDGTINSKRHHTVERLVAGQVCRDCNGGWMSQLEQEAIPILKPLITGESVIVNLSDKERQIIGRWAAKTAFALNSSSNYLKNVPREHFNFIKANLESLPKNVFSYGQQNHGQRPFYWIQSPTWILSGETNNLSFLANQLKDLSYKIALQFGKLMLLVAYLPIQEIYPVLWRGIHVPLVPKSGKCGWYEKEEFSWSNSQKAIYEFHLGLQAIVIKND